MKFIVISSAVLILLQANIVFSLRGGSFADPGQFPFLVTVQWGLPPFIPLRHDCAGSIIKPKWILTAAHCFIDQPAGGKYVIKVGVHDLARKGPHEKIYPIKRIINHDRYLGGAVPYDIAVIESKIDISYNEHVNEIRLPAQDTCHNGTVILSGWGTYCENNESTSQNILQTFTAPIVPNDRCEPYCKTMIDCATIYPNQLCIIAEIGMGTCPGDSGSPLIQIIDGIPVQLGITSWDLLPKDTTRASPTIYTRVSFFIDWIEEKTRGV